MKMVMIKNCIQCNYCGDIITSNDINDYKTCKCGRVSIDGGKEFCRRLYKTKGDYTEMNIFKNTK